MLYTQPWYTKFLAVLIFSCTALFAFSGAARAEDYEVSSTGVFTAPGSFRIVTYPMANDTPYPDRRTATCCNMSEDGSFLFYSKDSRLVNEPINNQQRLFMYDSTSKEIILLPKFNDNPHVYGFLSPDKSWMIAQTAKGGTFDSYYYSLTTREVQRFEYPDGSPVLSGGRVFPSGDGSRVVFNVSHKDLVPEDQNGLNDLYLWDRTTKQPTLVTVGKDGKAASGGGDISLSADGNLVTFTSSDINRYFDAPCGWSGQDVLQKNLTTGAYMCVTTNIDDTDGEAFGVSHNSLIVSANGQVIVTKGRIQVGFNLKDTNYYIINLASGLTPIQQLAHADTFAVRLSADGTTVFYVHQLDVSGTRDMCTFEVFTTETNCYRIDPQFYISVDLLSPRGRYMVLESRYHKLIGSTVAAANTYTEWNDLFLWDREGENYFVRGQVTGDDGLTGIAGVRITGSNQEQYETDASGYYTMPYLLAGTPYTITPASAGKTFNPTQVTFSVPPSKIINFTTRIGLELSLPISETRGMAFALTGNPGGAEQGRVNSWFDHTSPQYDNDTSVVMTPWSGIRYTAITQGVSFYNGHDGIDFSRPQTETGATLVYAAASGVVTRTVDGCVDGVTSCGGGLGNQVWIDHGNGYATVYGHLANGSLRISNGNNVKTGNTLGVMGNTGNSSNTHLHFGVHFDSLKQWRQAGTSLDPFGWISLDGAVDPWKNTANAKSTCLWQSWCPQPQIVTTNFPARTQSGRVELQTSSGFIYFLTDADIRPEFLNTLRYWGLGWLWTIQDSLGNQGVQASALTESVPVTITAKYSENDLLHLNPQTITSIWSADGRSWSVAPHSMGLDQITITNSQAGYYAVGAELLCPEDISEPDDSSEAAEEITINEAVTGVLDITEDQDWFKFTPTAGTKYAVTTTAGKLQFFAADGVTEIQLVDGELVGTDSNDILLLLTPDSTSGCEVSYSLVIKPFTEQETSLYVFLPLIQR